MSTYTIGPESDALPTSQSQIESLQRLVAQQAKWRVALERIVRLPESYPGAHDAANGAVQIAREALAE